MKLSATFARAFSEFNCIIVMIIEKCSNIIKDESDLLSQYMSRRIKDLFGIVDRVCDNNDFGYVLYMSSLVNAASYCEKFGFRTCNVDHMVQSFDHQFIVNMNVCNRHSDIVFDTGISNNECIGRSIGGFNSYVVELLNTILEETVIAFIK